MRKIPFYVASIGSEEIREVVKTLRSGWITAGPRTQKFEKEFAAYIGAKHAIAVNSCTSGLHLSLIALGVGPGDEVITTPYTFAATCNTVLQTGAKLTLVDICENGYNIDPDKILAAINSNTKVIVPVHFAGEPCEMGDIMNIARHYRLAVLEDAAHALGASIDGSMIGAIGSATSFSFYATKNLTTGEGGMITTNIDEVAEKVKILRLHGISKDSWQRYSNTGHWYYEIKELGYKYNMSDIQAAIGLKQLLKYSMLQEKRKALYKYYLHKLEDIAEISLPSPRLNGHAFHLFVIRLNSAGLTINRNRFIDELNARGIGTSVHFIPIHFHPFYQRFCGFKQGDFPIAEIAYRASISLPLYPNLTFDQIDYITESIKKVIARHKIRIVVKASC